MTTIQLLNFVKQSKKIVAATTNFRSLLKILNVPAPVKPTIFMKPTSSYIVEGQMIEIPEGFSVNQEIELGVVIGKKCKNVRECEAMDYVGGYCVALDMTAICQMKEARNKGLPWLLGKGFDTACPISRFISKEEIPDPCKVELWTCINGELKAEGNTRDFIFSIPHLISYISQYMTLEPCDVLLTGTPGMSPVKPGDEIEGGIRGLVTFKFKVKEKC